MIFPRINEFAAAPGVEDHVQAQSVLMGIEPNLLRRAAVLDAILRGRGEWDWLTDPEIPYELEESEVKQHIQQGVQGCLPDELREPDVINSIVAGSRELSSTASCGDGASRVSFLRDALLELSLCPRTDEPKKRDKLKLTNPHYTSSIYNLARLVTFGPKKRQKSLPDVVI